MSMASGRHSHGHGLSCGVIGGEARSPRWMFGAFAVRGSKRHGGTSDIAFSCLDTDLIKHSSTLRTHFSQD